MDKKRKKTESFSSDKSDIKKSNSASDNLKNSSSSGNLKKVSSSDNEEDDGDDQTQNKRTKSARICKYGPSCKNSFFFFFVFIPQ